MTEGEKLGLSSLCINLQIRNANESKLKLISRSNNSDLFCLLYLVSDPKQHPIKPRCFEILFNSLGWKNIPRGQSLDHYFHFPMRKRKRKENLLCFHNFVSLSSIKSKFSSRVQREKRKSFDEKRKGNFVSLNRQKLPFSFD